MTPVADSPEAVLLLLSRRLNSTTNRPDSTNPPSWQHEPTVLAARTHRPDSTNLPPSKILRHDFSDNQTLTPYGGGIFRFPVFKKNLTPCLLPLVEKRRKTSFSFAFCLLFRTFAGINKRMTETDGITTVDTECL